MSSKLFISLLSVSVLTIPVLHAMEDDLERALHEYRTFAAPVLRQARLRERAKNQGVIRVEQLMRDGDKSLVSRHRVAEDIEDSLELSPTGTKICVYNSQTHTLDLRRVGEKKVFKSIDLTLPDENMRNTDPSVTWSADEKYLLVMLSEHPKEFIQGFTSSTSLVLIDIESGERKSISALSNSTFPGVGLASCKETLKPFEKKIYWFGMLPGKVTLYYVYDIETNQNRLLEVFPIEIDDLVILPDGTPFTADRTTKKNDEFFVWNGFEFISRYVVSASQKERGHRLLGGNENQVLTLQPVDGDKVQPVVVNFDGKTRTETPIFFDDQMSRLNADVGGALCHFGHLDRLLAYETKSLNSKILVLGDWTGFILEGLKRSLEELGKLSFNTDVLDISRDFKRMFVSLESPSVPKFFRIYEYVEGTLKVLEEFSPTPWLDSLRGLFSPAKIVSYTSFDGLEIPAILTRPDQAKPGEKLPTVLLIHGGPVARDKWVFDPEVQYLASHGYLVLQPQFRGTKGYGLKHKNAIFGHWDHAIQDIMAGRQWLIEKGLADPDRMAIMGTSFGGWAALQALTEYPGVFQCGIANCPLTDPAMAITRKDISRENAEYWIRHFGKARPELPEGRAILSRFSPLQNVRKVQDPVLLMHGELDKIVEFKQSEQLAERFQDLEKRYTFVRFPQEEHGNSSNDALRVEFAAVDNFLVQHLGGIACESLQDELRRTADAVLVSHRQ